MYLINLLYLYFIGLSHCVCSCTGTFLRSHYDLHWWNWLHVQPQRDIGGAWGQPESQGRATGADGWYNAYETFLYTDNNTATLVLYYILSIIFAVRILFCGTILSVQNDLKQANISFLQHCLFSSFQKYVNCILTANKPQIEVVIFLRLFPVLWLLCRCRWSIRKWWPVQDGDGAGCHQLPMGHWWGSEKTAGEEDLHPSTFKYSHFLLLDGVVARGLVKNVIHWKWSKLLQTNMTWAFTAQQLENTTDGQQRSRHKDFIMSINCNLPL